MPIVFGLFAALGIMWDIKRRLLFIHIPKTAGTSIESAMKRAMHERDGKQSDRAAARNTAAEAAVVCPACVPYPEQYHGSRCWQALGPTSTEYQPNFEHNSELVAYNVLRRCRNYTGSVLSFAVVRNPLNRLISAYNYARNDGEKMAQGTFAQFMSKKRMHLFKRPQVEYISPCTTVFAYERLDDVWEMLGEVYPVLPRKRQNVATKPAFVPHPSVVEQIMTDYREDWDLWLRAITRSKAKGWWRNVPCSHKALNRTRLNFAVRAAWRSIEEGQVPPKQRMPSSSLELNGAVSEERPSARRARAGRARTPRRAARGSRTQSPR